MATEATLLQDHNNSYSSHIPIPTTCSPSSVNDALYIEFLQQDVGSLSQNLSKCFLGLNDDPNEFFKACNGSRWNLIHESETTVDCNICYSSLKLSVDFEKPFFTFDT
ncbi:hypothetical protein IFR05_017410, partial [Cadophora sp. M221]